MAHIVRPDQDFAPLATDVEASAEDSGYVAANLIEENPANPAKLTTTSGWWKLTFDAKRKPVAVALIYHYLDAGLDVRIEANNVDSWTSPPLSVAITIPAKRFDGPSFQKWTNNALALIDEDEYGDPDGYLYWRLHIVGTNSQACAVGRLWLPTELTAIDIFHASTIGELDEPTNIVNFTEMKRRLVTVIGGPQRGLSGAFIGTDLDAGSAPVQEAAAFRGLYESTDSGSLSFLLLAQLRGDDDLEPWQADFESIERVHGQGGYQVWTFLVREASRGVPWP